MRELAACIISDTHLGSKSSNTKALCHYLNTISPQLLILNGDIIDIWAFSKSKFNNKHSMVISRILKMVEEGTEVIYVTGNHDEALRRFSPLSIGGISLVDKYVFEMDGDKYWVFHGDIFDLTTKGNARVIAKMGGFGYDLLIVLNRWINNLLELFGLKRLSLSKKIKKSVKSAMKWISNFESIVADLAISSGYDYVVCGHIHEPKIEKIENREGSVTYLNSGDWVENLTALEYSDKKWRMFCYNDRMMPVTVEDSFSLKKNEDAMIMDLINNLNSDYKRTAFDMFTSTKK